MLLLFTLTGAAQVASPFDLSPRLDTNVVLLPQAQPANAASGEGAATTSNPFDLIRSGSPLDAAQQTKGPRSSYILEWLKANGLQQDNLSKGKFTTILVFSLLGLFTLMIVAFGSSLKRMQQAYLNGNLLNRLQREQNKLPYQLWAVAACLIVAAFIQLGMHTLGIEMSQLSGQFLLLLFLCVGGIVALKLLILAFLQRVFPLQKFISPYIMLIVTNISLLGVALLIPLIFMAFAPLVLAQAAAYLGLALLVGSLLVRSLRMIGNTSSILSRYPLHFILYLCALEIGPLAVFIRLAAG